MISVEDRAHMLKKFGASESEADELLAYNENHFNQTAPGSVAGDEPFVRTWELYIREAESSGAYTCLQRHLVQLQFPVERGISTRPEYVAATRRGVPARGYNGPKLADPASITFALHSTPAGRIPLIIVPTRSDFIALVQCMARRNEPDEIHDSVGACFVSGYNNWDRIRRHRRELDLTHPERDRSTEFARLIRSKELYQDRFIILSDGFYSGIPASEMGMSDVDWRQVSLAIRREHECAHYYTRRCLGSMRNNLLDECIADYMGIVEAHGDFRADWFLRFFGLEDYPAYRSGSRFENYTGGLSAGATAILRHLVVHAASYLERMFAARGRGIRSLDQKAAALRRLTTLTLEEMADLSGTAVTRETFSPSALH